MIGMNFSASLDSVVGAMRSTGKKISETATSVVNKYKKAQSDWESSPQYKAAQKKAREES